MGFIAGASAASFYGRPGALGYMGLWVIFALWRSLSIDADAPPAEFSLLNLPAPEAGAGSLRPVAGHPRWDPGRATAVLLSPLFHRRMIKFSMLASATALISSVTFSEAVHAAVPEGLSAILTFAALVPFFLASSAGLSILNRRKRV